MARKVILYGTSTCVWCKKTREFFLENKIKFRYVDVGRNVKAAREMIKKSGQIGVPVIEIEGEIVIGYDEDKLKKLLLVK